MKDYFIRLINYDQFANQTILKSVRAANDPEKPVQLMSHLLAAQQTWLTRCKGGPLATYVLWPDWKADALEQTINTNTQAWLAYLNTLAPADFEKDVFYKNSAGTAYHHKLSDILAHLINHGTHHRAQAGQQLKFAGVENLPTTDYIFYIRN